MPKPSIKKIAIIISTILLLIAGYFFFLQKPETVMADWWDDSWLYRQTVAITNSGTAQTDFQVMITLDSATLIAADKMQSDCDDIRLTDINGKLIPYWIEPTTCDTSATKIWTKVPSISTSGDTIYLYYGNSAVNSVSSVAETFIREISGVQGAWDMDEASANTCSGGVNDSCDSSGNGNDGAWNGDATNTTGKFGNGVIFDGNEDYINAGNDSSLDITGEITIEAWVKFGDYTSDVVVSKGGYYDSYTVATGTYAEKLRIILNDVGSLYSPKPDLDRFYHVVYTYNGSIIRAYYDGTSTGSASASGSIDSTADSMYIGKENYSYYFNGTIDNVRIYNQALTQAEITDLYGTGGDRHGYVTTNYPNKSLARKYSASVSVGSPASEERGPGPVAYWKFDEGFGQTTNDSTINANNGTLGATSGSESSDPTWQTEDMCLSGKCLKFDGSNDYVEIPSSASSSLGGASATTVCAWVNRNNQISTRDVIIDLTISGGENSKVFLEFQADDTIRLGGRADLLDTFQSEITTSTYSKGDWHFIVGILDIANDDIKIYVDGAEQSTTGTPSWSQTTFDADVGSLQVIGASATPSNHFNGFIDSVKIYPYARTAAQIKADYASRGTASGSSAVIASEAKQSLSDGLVGYWKMDEASWDGTADEVVDASGAGNDGVAVGATGIPTTGAGKFGNGGVFDGVDDYVKLPYQLCDNPTVSCSNGAISILFTPTTTIPSSDAGAYTLFSKSTSDWGGIYVQISSAHIYFRNQENGTDHVATTSDQDWNAGTWYNVVMTWGSGGMKIFINGVESGSNSYTGAWYEPEDLIPSIGLYYNNLNDSLSAPFAGSIDEVRIYNRALSPGEVRDLYNFAPGPVGWWKMDEKVSGNGQTINDSSGYGNTGTTSSANGTGMDCMVPGKYGSACNFDGVDDYVTVNTNGLDSLGSTAHSVGLWAKMNGEGTSEKIYWTLINKNNGGDGHHDIAHIWINDGGNNTLILRVGDGIAGQKQSSDFGSMSDYNWHYIAMSYDGSRYYYLYFDGVLATTLDAGVDWVQGTNTGYLRLGEWIAYHNHFNGSIDDVRIYNYARTPAQIAEDYAGGAGRKKQPIAHWKFDEGYGTTANNSGIGGSALNGTLTGMSSPATATSGWTDSGKIGKGLVFDGSDDYVDIGDLDITGAMTIGFWINFSVKQNQMMLGRYGSWSVPQWGVWVLSAGTVYFRINDAVNSPTSISGGTDIVDSNWHHIVAVRDTNTDFLYIYVDGVSDATPVVDVTGDTTPSSNLYIGKENAIYWDGSIDDVKIYNFALTEDEVREEYNSGVATKLGSTGTDSSGNPDDSQSREYCIPGDTSTCNPPVGRWDFNEGTGSTVNDISGNNNTGTWSGTGSHWTTGKIGKGGSFNGSDDYVNAGSNVSLKPINVTYELWFKTNVSTSQWLINKFQEISEGWGILIGSNVSIYDDIDNNDETRYATAINTNQWYHVVAILDDLENKLYLNGVLVGSGGNSTGSFASFDGTTYIGQRGNNTGYFNGSIDQVRIYNYARTAAQVAWDYNRGKPIAHWKFDECQGGTAYDSSGNGNNGTITIGATVPQDGIGTCTDGDTSNAWYNGRTGKYNSAMSFDGEDDYVEIADADILDLSNFTLEAWVKRNSSGTLQGIIIKGNVAANADLPYALYFDSDDSLDFNIGNDTTYSVLSGETITDTNWHHIVATANSSTLAIYIDGIPNVSTPQTIFPFASDEVLLVGSIATTSYPFDGLIDDVKIYNYALTAEQIKTEYNNGAVNFR